MYELFLIKEANRTYQKAEPVLVRKLNRRFQHLFTDPYDHPNVRRLKGPLAGHLRYRAGDWRIVYQVHEE
ncbi:MAG: type II toxin-antitoxin system RelE/ParE family toxin [Anaerolineae bacterium]|jgi:mRNA interferase RelE/StbE